MKLDIAFMGREEFARRPIVVKESQQIEKDAGKWPHWKMVAGSLLAALFFLAICAAYAVLGG